MWVRQLKSGQQVSYDHLPHQEVVALALALDEWEYRLHRRRGGRRFALAPVEWTRR
jgi:hypothetical protein